VTLGEPNDEESDGGGTDGYVSCRPGRIGWGAGKLKRGPDDGGDVMFVCVLAKLADGAWVSGEKGKGESVEDGEWERGVSAPEEVRLWFIGRCICEGGRGIGIPF
jgi:hypothetical protein